MSEPWLSESWHETEARILAAELSRYRYFVTYPGEDAEREVDVHQWRSAERAAGFRSQFGPDYNATAGFGGNGYHGRMELIPADPEHSPTGRLPRTSRQLPSWNRAEPPGWMASSVIAAGLSGQPENPGSCPSCGSPDRGELYYVPGRSGPVSCSSDWHDDDARGPDDDPRNDQETRS
jgi:hypothetical protein